MLFSSLTPQVIKRPRSHRFHFEAFWMKKEDCRGIIESVWGSISDMNTPEGMACGLKLCASGNSWNSSTLGQIPKLIQEKRKMLSKLTEQHKDGFLGMEINNVSRELNGLLDDEEIFWGQRSKVHWLKEGDRNTKNFHARASERRKQNMITVIWDKFGRWCEDKDSIANAAVTYFEDIYSTSNPSMVDEVTVVIPTIVTEEMNMELSRNFTREEIVTALKQIHPTKSPGPDGMSAIFFQKYWDIVGSNVSNMILNVLNYGMSLDVINKTNIVLIPKTNNPKRMTNFRPISLCNVIYKLISKTLANHLKAFLHLIITENQSAFTADRLITDNVLLAYELMHYLKHKKEGKNCFMAMNLDMSKAFDRVEWGFIEGVMRKMGFNEGWISLVMRCVSSVSYSVIINGDTFGNIIPSRGLKQGDPLSPYLFLLCAEGLSTLLHEAARNQLLNGISLCRVCPKIIHLFFADDSLLFCKANSEECEKLKEILEKYEAASGQKVNSDKSSIYFSPNTTLELKETIFNILGPMQDSRQNKYLGLPSIIGKSKKQVFVEIKERVGLKLASWKGKLLSLGGKEILIKAVAQAIPTYTMSCFLLPKSLCDELEKMMRNFWWGQKNQESKVA